MNSSIVRKKGQYLWQTQITGIIILNLDINKLKVFENEFEVKAPTKNLGVVFDCDLSFNEQINQVIRTAG